MPAAKSYHHGRLREALLDASSTLIRERGLDRFTLREVARRAGVSHAAPYRHFRDKEEILHALAVGVYKRIADRIIYHSLKGYSPAECLELGALAYLRFALDKPDDFRLLLALGPNSTVSPTLLIEALESLVAACFMAQQKQAALILWVHIHGIAELASRNQPGIESRKEALVFAARSLHFLIASLIGKT